MVTIYNPNVLAAAGLIIMACGLGLLAKSVLSSSSLEDGPRLKRAHAASRIDLAFAVPFLVAGIVALAASQFVLSGLTPWITAILLLAAFGLVLYAGYEGLMVDGNPALAVVDAAAPASRLKLIAAPALAAPAPAPAAPTPAALAAEAAESIAVTVSKREAGA